MNEGFRVVYPRGDKSKLYVSYVLDYEEDDYKLASVQVFNDISDCIEYAKALARKHNKEYVEGHTEQEYLD